MQTYTVMTKYKMEIINLSTLKSVALAAALFIPLTGFTQQTQKNNKSSERVDVTYKQRHSKQSQQTLYADGIKIKRDLSLIDKIQEERVLDADEIPADDLYGGVWSNRYVGVYGGVENVPDTFRVDLSNFVIPTYGHITSNYGPRRRRMHYGIDLKVQVGDTIYAAFDGKIRVCQYERRGYGYYVVMRHTNGLETVYGHLSKFLVKEDQVIRAGEAIALGGNTGRSTGSHLHFETRFLGKPFNPKEIIDFDNKTCHRDSYRITPKSFLSNGSKESTLAASKKIKTPGTNKYVAGNVKYHRVGKGETLYSIAKKYGTTVGKLTALNNMRSNGTLKVGKSLRLP